MVKYDKIGAIIKKIIVSKWVLKLSEGNIGIRYTLLHFFYYKRIFF
jgi:hypothetical protein